MDHAKWTQIMWRTARGPFQMVHQLAGGGSLRTACD